MISNMTWRKSSYSGGEGGNCVAVAGASDRSIAVRDTKKQHGPMLRFSDAEWRIFTAQIKKFTDR